jgi:hypothetical protein
MNGEKIRQAYELCAATEMELDRVKTALDYEVGASSYEAYGFLVSAYQLVEAAGNLIGIDLTGSTEPAFDSGKEASALGKVARNYGVPVEDVQVAIDRVIAAQLESAATLRQKADEVIGALGATISSK